MTTEPLEPQPRTAADDLAALCQQVSSLATTLPPPLGHVRLALGETCVEVGWHDPAVAVAAAEHPAPAPQRPSGAAIGSGPRLAPAPGPVAVLDDADEGHRVTAPLVGTFYAAPSPGSPPFVTVGEVVEVGQNLGIVEAMKLMNPIVSDVAGRVLEVLVSDGQAVEYDQPLVRVATGEDAATLAQAG